MFPVPGRRRHGHEHIADAGDGRRNLANLPIRAAGAEIRKAITTGALMGAHAKLGVITSQILRGLREAA